MAENHLDFDVVIIGGGPAGASAALYTARLNLKTVVLDKSIRAGALGLTSKIANYPGIIEELTGEELVERLRQHAQKFGAEFREARVMGTILDSDPKQVFTAEGDIYSARAVILATGAMGRAKTIAGEEEFLGHGVSYCAICDGAFFAGLPVLVIGSGEEAVKEALILTKFADKVYLASPKGKLNADPDNVEQLLATGKVEVLMGVRVKQVMGNGLVEGAMLSRGGQDETLPVRGVFIYTTGNKPIVDYLQGQVDTMADGCVIVDRDMQTSIAGVFACGDLLCAYVQQAVVAAAQGVTAALSADKYLNKRAKLVKDYK